MGRRIFRGLLFILPPFEHLEVDTLHMLCIYLVFNKLSVSQSVESFNFVILSAGRVRFVRVGLLDCFVRIMFSSLSLGRTDGRTDNVDWNLPWKRGERLSPSTKLNCTPRWYIKSRMNGGDKQETLPRYYSCCCCHVTT